MKKVLINLCAFIACSGSCMTTIAAPPPLMLQLNPIIINGYMDNTACLRDKTQPCGPAIPIQGSEEITFKSFGVGYFTVRNWDTSYLKLEPNSDFQNSEIIVRDPQGNPAYKIKLEGSFEITEKLIHIDQSQTWGWEPCGGDSNKKDLADALRGVPMRCLNTNSKSHLSGFKVKYDIKGTLYRLSDADMRQLNLPIGLKVTVNAKGEGSVGGGIFDGTDTEDLFKGGTIRLNDRKCYINLPDLKVNFGDLTPTGDSPMRKEVPTSIPLFCSGFTETIGSGPDAVVRDINGAGIKNTINGISIQANQLADGNVKRIALPDRNDLFVEVGQDSQKMCSTGTTISVDDSQRVGGIQENGPVWNKPGTLEAQPVKLYWRLCQKDIKTPLTPGAFKDQPAAKIRINYN